jgi:hypothetical protein
MLDVSGSFNANDDIQIKKNVPVNKNLSKVSPGP